MLCCRRLKEKKCGCTDDLFHRGVPLCTLNQTEARKCVDSLRKNVNPSVDCDCPNECFSDSYDVTVTQLEWPTNRSISLFVTNVYQQLNNDSAVYYVRDAIDKYLRDKLSNTQEGLAHLRSTFGSVTVFFPDLSVSSIEERPVYNLVMILSNIGGLLGLYLGFSVLTILEVVDFGFDIVEYIRLRGKKASLQRYLSLKYNHSCNESTKTSSSQDTASVSSGEDPKQPFQTSQAGQIALDAIACHFKDEVLGSCNKWHP